MMMSPIWLGGCAYRALHNSLTERRWLPDGQRNVTCEDGEARGIGTTIPKWVKETSLLTSSTA